MPFLTAFHVLHCYPCSFDTFAGLRKHYTLARHNCNAVSIIYKSSQLRPPSCIFHLPKTSINPPRLQLTYQLAVQVYNHSPLYFNTTHTSQHHNHTYTAMPCRAKQALLRGMKPNSQQQIVTKVCSRQCIFCDIWRLAEVVYTRIPLSQKYGTQQPRRQSSRASSPTHRETYEWESSEKVIEYQFSQQRSRLSSIMSICTVEGAEESEGLHVAHSRCLQNIQSLLYQESVLESTLVRSLQQAQRRPSDTCGSMNSDYYYGRERRSSRVGLAA